MTERESFWRQAVQRQVRSGMSIAAFCEAEAVSTASFYAWRKRLRDVRGRREPDFSHQRPQFVSVAVPAVQACVEIVLPCGTVLRVAEGTEPQTLRDILAALEPAAC